MGILGNMFDFDGDGELNTIEQAAEWGFLSEMMESEESEDDE